MLMVVMAVGGVGGGLEGLSQFMAEKEEHSIVLCVVTVPIIHKTGTAPFTAAINVCVWGVGEAPWSYTLLMCST